MARGGGVQRSPQINCITGNQPGKLMSCQVFLPPSGQLMHVTNRRALGHDQQLQVRHLEGYTLTQLLAQYRVMPSSFKNKQPALRMFCVFSADIFPSTVGTEKPLGNLGR